MDSYITYEELLTILPNAFFIEDVNKFTTKMNGRKIKPTDAEKLFEYQPALLYRREILEYIEMKPEFVIKMLDNGYYSSTILSLPNIRSILNSDLIINLLIEWAKNPARVAFFRLIDLKYISNENAKKILDIKPILVTRMKNSNAELDVYSFKIMNDKQKALNFLQLSTIDRVIFYGDLSEIKKILDEEFLLFTAKTVLILSGLPTYMQDKQVNVQKLHLHLLERENSKELFKKANFELKLEPELREVILSSLLPF